MKRFLALFLLPTFLLFASQADASENWVINRFHSDINILEDGEVRVVESIEADFGSEQKHGIFRDIPEVYEIAEGGKYYTKIEVTSVKNNEADTPYEILREGGYFRLKIGDPDEPITGVQ